MHWLLLSIYAIALTFIFFYSLTQLQLVLAYRKNRSTNSPLRPEFISWPNVTIQLPLYNELYVAERLIRKIAELDYPEELLEVQILDDSNDKTSEIALKTIESLGDKGDLFQLIQRPDRKGFKAGALKYGLEKATGEYIAIFDSDFLPQPDFLKKTIPYFTQKTKLGVVQTRWGHLNKDFNLLTKCQAFGLDAHFSVEQVGRNSQNHFINFNGTGGVWRKKCIEDAGNWQADTLTEDLDLSYRAQLRGWDFQYLEEVSAPAELPVSMPALKSQQFRWTKGAAENTRKNLKKVLKRKLPFSTKIHACFHLMNSMVFISVFICSFLSIPVLWIKNEHLELSSYFKISSLFVSSLFFLMAFYATSYFRDRKLDWKNILRFTAGFPVFLSITMGLSIHNTIAVIEGYAGKKSPFIRTPKFNIIEGSKNWKQNIYRIKSLGLVTQLEVLACLYFILGIALSYHLNDYSLIHLFSLLAFGYGSVVFFSIKHS